MGIQPETSHHEEGPGQQEIDFRFSDALSAADNAVTFKNVVKAVAQASGAYADFSPKPIEGKSGNGMHINISIRDRNGRAVQDMFMAGIMEHIREITMFLNPQKESYLRLGEKKAPKYITWSPENRSQLIRIPAAGPANRRIELRSPDTMANPYYAYALLIRAGLDGIRRGLQPPAPTNVNLFKAGDDITSRLDRLPQTLDAAREAARESRIVRECLPEKLLETLEIG